MKNQSLKDLLHLLAQGQTVFDHAVFKKVNLQTRLLPFMSFRQANVPEADFRHSILPGANFRGAILAQSHFAHANLLASDWDWANLTRVDFSHALLASASMIGANLANANLTGASLALADLSSANLRNANLLGANLRGANLSKANLFGARVDTRALADANIDMTVMPDGDCVTHNRRPNVSVANLISYTRIGRAVDQQRQTALTKTPEQLMLTAMVSAKQRSQAASPVSLQRQAQPIGFKLAENSGDLELQLLPLRN